LVRSRQRVDNYEYELPADYEDEEIDEDAAFNEEDKKLYAEHFPVDEDGAGGGGGGADLLESEDEEPADLDRDDLSPSEVLRWAARSAARSAGLARAAACASGGRRRDCW
jgi:U3 small nucleolar RNA-associated protein 14